MPRPTCGADAALSAPPVLVMVLMLAWIVALFDGVTAVKAMRG